MEAKIERNRDRLVKVIHVAKRSLGMGDADYRALLSGVCGKDSCANATHEELKKILAAFKALGFEVAKPEPVKDMDMGGKGHATYNQIKYIKWAWFKVARNKSDEALNKFVFTITGEPGLRMCTTAQASDVVRALHDWESKNRRKKHGKKS